MRWRGRGAGLLVAALLAATTGCGDGEAPAGRPSPTPTAPTSAPTTEGNGDMVPPLPDLTVTPKSTVSTAAPPTRLLGGDVSWPQCPKGMGIPEKRSEGKPMPTRDARFVVIGLTNGPSFFANPCLADQVRWAKERHLLVAAYSVVSFPDDQTLARLREEGPFPGDTRLGGLRNVGYQAALFNVGSMRVAGLTTPMVWVDVEPVPFFEWSPDVRANAAVVQGMVRGYRDAGFRVGFYSLPSLWTRVVGSLRFGLPEWRPAGERGITEALERCGEDWSFQGGPAVLGQWVEDDRDRNVTCPGAGDVRQWFHQY